MQKSDELQCKITEITARIRELRNILGLSPEDMAKHLGLDVDDYNSYEAGEQELNFGFLYTCAQVLGVAVTELI